MKYLNLSIQAFLTYKGKKKQTPSAYYGTEMLGAEFFHNHLSDASRIVQNTLVKNRILHQLLPLLDHFVLKALYAECKRKFDWIKLDVYRLALGDTFVASGGWLVSERFKQIVSQYNLSEHKFYPAKLLFKDELLDYYFIQWGKQVDLSFGNCTYALRNRRKYPTNYTDPEPIFEFWESERISASELKIRDRDDDNRRSIEFTITGGV